MGYDKIWVDQEAYSGLVLYENHRYPLSNKR